MLPASFQCDPRHYQIAVLTTLLVCGTYLLGLPVGILDALVILIAAQLTQFIGSRVVGQPFDPKSAMITALSLTLLLRSDTVALLACAATAAIASKFLLRVGGKHVFNPANFAIVLLILVSDRAWISTGQWGSTAISAFALACCGFLVLTRARRAETTLAFLGSYALLLFCRAFWLGDPLSIPVHQLQNGALLIFAFFMISDPKTTPNAASARLLYGALVAGAAFVMQFVFYEPYGVMFALFGCAWLVPVLDAVVHGNRYRWNKTISPSSAPRKKEFRYATAVNAVHGHRHYHS